MSVCYAPVPPEPSPWELQEYENFSCDEKEEDGSDDDIASETLYSDTDYDSENEPNVKKKPVGIPTGLYKNILQEEEYFSE